MAKQIVTVPDIGGDKAEVIEISVSVGDVLEEEQAVVVLETDKASMDIPTPMAGKVIALKVNQGDSVGEGDPLIEIEAEAAGEAPAPKQEEKPAPAAEKAPKVEAPAAAAPEPVASGKPIDVVVTVPEGAEDADIIEIIVAVGDQVAEGESLLVLETEKASMEVPAPESGKVASIAVKQGDKTIVGGELMVLEVIPTVESAKPAAAPAAEAKASAEAKPAPTIEPPSPARVTNEQVILAASQSKDVYAGPSVRKLAREMAVELTAVKGTGERGRITKDDVKGYVKDVMTGKQPTPVAASGGSVAGGAIPVIPEVDFSQFGEIELQPMSKIKKLTAANMTRNWLNVPHVTQFDEADITELESFRKSLKAEAEKRGVKLSPVPFLIKACAAALVAEPSFNVSLHHDGEHIVQKHYVNIGVAVDSPVGLVVPVIRDVDKKGLWELAEEFMLMVTKARDAKLTPKDMQGGCFTVSSLGAMGGNGFTPIVNAPEVAILGVSKAQIKPVWNGSEFAPRNMLPLSLSYDHRAINGGDAGRFFTYLNSVISDIRRLLL